MWVSKRGQWSNSSDSKKMGRARKERIGEVWGHPYLSFATEIKTLWMHFMVFFSPWLSWGIVIMLLFVPPKPFWRENYFFHTFYLVLLGDAATALLQNNRHGIPWTSPMTIVELDTYCHNICPNLWFQVPSFLWLVDHSYSFLFTHLKIWEWRNVGKSQNSSSDLHPAPSPLLEVLGFSTD